MPKRVLKGEIEFSIVVYDDKGSIYPQTVKPRGDDAVIGHMEVSHVNTKLSVKLNGVPLVPDPAYAKPKSKTKSKKVA